MFARWSGLFIQAVTISRGVEVDSGPQARFSPSVHEADAGT